jgi:molybdopterin molybdotransferase
MEERTMRRNVSLEEAHGILLNSCAPVPERRVSIADASGRILSRDIRAAGDMPPFNKSAMDGYAVRACDTISASHEKRTTLRVIDKITAGFVPTQKVVAGSAVKIMTGAPLPEGADCVIRFEDVEIHDDYIAVAQKQSPGGNVIHTGEELGSGDLIAGKGTRVTPSLVGIMAGLGMSEIPVYRGVVAAVMSTGSELLDPSEAAAPGKIYNNSLYGIMARCTEIGVRALNLGMVPDMAESVSAMIVSGLRDADCVITTGGVSSGECDVVEEGMLLAGATILFKGLAVRSGSSIRAGIKNGKFILALSGNPVAALSTFDLTGTTLLKKLMGLAKPFPPRVEAVMTDNVTTGCPARRLLHARLFRQDGIDCVSLTGSGGRGKLVSLLRSNFLVDVPSGTGYIAAGQKVMGYLVGDTEQIYLDSSAWIPGVLPLTAAK